MVRANLEVVEPAGRNVASPSASSQPRPSGSVMCTVPASAVLLAATEECRRHGVDREWGDSDVVGDEAPVVRAGGEPRNALGDDLRWLEAGGIGAVSDRANASDGLARRRRPTRR